MWSWQALRSRGAVVCSRRQPWPRRFAVKFLPVVLAPLLWRRVSLRDALAGVGLIWLAYLPFLDSTLTPPVGSLGAYTEIWRFNGPIFALLEPWLGVAPVLALAAAAGVAVASSGSTHDVCR